MIHQYIDRRTREVRTEELFGDPLIRLIYDTAREKLPFLYKTATSARMSDLLAYVNYTLPGGHRLTGADRVITALGVNLDECVIPRKSMNTARKIFQRQIRYWDCRPMPDDPDAVASPADARMLVGSLAEQSRIFIKEKFFTHEELFMGGEAGPDRLRREKAQWARVFRGGDFAVFRLTPEKYHYNHVPVTGFVDDIYEIDGRYHACNPTAMIHAVTPLSKNKRVVTILNTDIPGGARIGRVAMIEVAALMIGDIKQCYSDSAYDAPRPVTPGMVLEKGRPKSVYLPGSSVDVLVFEKDRIRFCPDIIENMHRTDAQSRFSKGFGQSLVETDILVRDTIAVRSK